MANTFKLKTKANVGITTQNVYVVPSATTTVVIGITLANVSGSGVIVGVGITRPSSDDVKVLKNRILINNQEIKTYTFKQDYFWMMGDNRHNSEDSRSWGFVPEDHIIGKPVFIWMSIDGFMDGISNWKPRWNRIFSTVGGEGERKSYFGYFIGLLMIWQVLVFVRKRRKTN